MTIEGATVEAADALAEMALAHDIPEAEAQEMIARARLIASDPRPVDEPALVALWRREYDGMASRAIVDFGIHGPDMALKIADDALAAGCTPSVVLDALDECDKLYGDE